MTHLIDSKYLAELQPNDLLAIDITDGMIELSAVSSELMRTKIVSLKTRPLTDSVLLTEAQSDLVAPTTPEPTLRAQNASETLTDTAGIRGCPTVVVGERYTSLRNSDHAVVYTVESIQMGAKWPYANMRPEKADAPASVMHIVPNMAKSWQRRR